MDGLLLISPVIDSQERKLLERLVNDNYPVVGIGPTPARADSVDWDRVGAYQRLTEHLLERGCRRLLFLANQETPGVRGRLEGIRAALKTAAGPDSSDAAALAAEADSGEPDVEKQPGGFFRMKPATRCLPHDERTHSPVARCNKCNTPAA